MVLGHDDFQVRLNGLMRKHRAMSRGYSARLRHDGLIITKPKRKASPISGRSVFLFLLAFIMFKGFVIASTGPITYSERVAQLQAGTVVEQAGAFVMQIEPVSEFVAMKIGPILR
ncbi:MAG: hypothetical protein AB8B51_13145 [Sedimentitalea sp.]